MEHRHDAPPGSRCVLGVRPHLRGRPGLGGRRRTLQFLRCVAARHQYRNDDRKLPDGVPASEHPEPRRQGPSSQAPRPHATASSTSRSCSGSSSGCASAADPRPTTRRWESPGNAAWQNRHPADRRCRQATCRERCGRRPYQGKSRPRGRPERAASWNDIDEQGDEGQGGIKAETGRALKRARRLDAQGKKAACMAECMAEVRAATGMAAEAR